MKNILAFIILTFPAWMSCNSKIDVDNIFHNGKIYTVDSIFSVAEAMAVNDGKIIAIGTNQEITDSYNSTKKINLNGKAVYPGFHDAHCHFYGYGVDKVKINLVGTTSFDEVINVLEKNSKKRFSGWVFGRGWDQNDWELKEYPTKQRLDSLFPDVPVMLLRIDGHAALLNSKGLELASFSTETHINGGEMLVENGELTGIIFDNAIDSVNVVIAKLSDMESEIALNAAEKDCFEVGLTSVTDAGYHSGGLKEHVIDIIEELYNRNELKIRVNAMAHLDELGLYKESGRYKNGKLTINGFKAYADGSLGSRGACLLKPYNDQPESTGVLLSSPDQLIEWISEVHDINMQLNIHCIGDSAQRFILNEYNKVLQGSNPNRWRIEHAQVINLNDLDLYKVSGVIPSVQPTHATSDMYWAEDRIGSERLKGAYAYKSLLNCNNIILGGSDFPVESINPLYGFYAAVSRKDQKGFPEEGFMPQEALTREEALKSMTIWPAYGAFLENEIGSLERGKNADFVILKDDIMTAPESELFKIKVLETWVEGEQVYLRKE
jgi:predicted amidohydrolase YtcJ